MKNSPLSGCLRREPAAQRKIASSSARRDGQTLIVCLQPTTFPPRGGSKSSEKRLAIREVNILALFGEARMSTLIRINYCSARYDSERWWSFRCALEVRAQDLAARAKGQGGDK